MTSFFGKESDYDVLAPIPPEDPNVQTESLSGSEIGVVFLSTASDGEQFYAISQQAAAATLTWFAKHTITMSLKQDGILIKSLAIYAYQVGRPFFKPTLPSQATSHKPGQGDLAAAGGA